MRHVCLPASILALVLAACGGSPPAPEPEPGDGSDRSCATISCPGSQTCVDRPEGPSCACTMMAMCVAGWTWDEVRCECVEENPGTGTGTVCTSDDQCRKVDSYCGGCNCLVLGPGEEAPACDDPVQCFAQPCGVTEGEPACVDGRCVLR